MPVPEANRPVGVDSENEASRPVGVASEVEASRPVGVASEVEAMSWGDLLAEAQHRLGASAAAETP